MTSAKSYYDIAADLSETAPQQAQLLKHLLMQKEMQDKDEICDKLEISRHNFPVIIAKLRDKGIEVVTKRIHAPGQPGVDARYVYGVATTEVENWSGDRRKSVMTAWERTTKVFERHLMALELPASEVYKILGVMEFVTKTLQDINLDVSIKAEEKATAAMEAALAEAPKLFA
jgi:biotin operon repressor